MSSPSIDDDMTRVDRAPAPPRAMRATPASVSASGAPVSALDNAVALLSLVRRVALQRDLASSVRVLGHGLAELVGCVRVHCLTGDPLSGQPWSSPAGDSLASLAALHRRAIYAQPARTCRVFRPEVDDPGASGHEKVLASPIVAGDMVVAVVIAVRGPSEAPFLETEGALVAAVGAQVAPLLLSALHAAALSAPSGDGGKRALFREQALERHRVQRREGAVLALSPRWIGRVYPAVLIGLGVALLYGVIGRVSQYSSGPAVIRIEGTEVTARAGGTVIDTYVEPGQPVKAGELLVQLHDDAEAAELGETLLDYERQLATFLFDPGSEQAKASLSSIAARRQKARQVLDARSIRAPRDGLVSDVRVREGSRLEAGDYIMTVVSTDATPTVIALLPGADRPRLRAGMELQFKIPGYEKTNEKAVISEVGQEVIGPHEARRYVGDKIADALSIKGSVVIVRAALPSRTFEARDKVYRFHDGMPAKAEVSVRRRPVLVALVPALEKVL